MAKKESYRCSTATFSCQGKEQFVTVEDNRDGMEVVRRRLWPTQTIVDETICPVTRHGCAIEEIAVSPSGFWLVTQRFSGQGEWGYDLFRTCPLTREAGLLEEYGYILDLPRFSVDERQLVGGFGERWLGGWWAHRDDYIEQPARGGLVSFGYLFVHSLPEHQVIRHELRMNLSPGWIPDEPEAEIWMGGREIQPVPDGVWMTLPGGARVVIEGPLPPVIFLPTPHASERRVLPGTGRGVKIRKSER